MRLDELLVQRGLCADAEEARRTIWSGQVIVAGEMIDQPAMQVPVDIELRIRGRRRYATRGGEKLEEALAVLGVEVEGRCSLDVGAHAGGFTDCLLAHGASRVYAVDVARGQLAQKLRLDPRVLDMGGRDVMSLESDDLKPAPSLAVVDVTFRSLSDVLPKVWGLISGRGEMVALVKPLHEAKLAGLGRVEGLQQSVLARLMPRLTQAGVPVLDVAACSSPGPGGALELFLHVKSPGRAESELSERAEAAVRAGMRLLSRMPQPKRSGQKRKKTWQRFGRRTP